jgi:hypothetical protein
MSKISIVIPEAPLEDVTRLTAERKLGTQGLRLGVLDNSKANADQLLALLVAGVKNEFDVSSVVLKRKPASSRPATDQLLDELARDADVVISAMAD